MDSSEPEDPITGVRHEQPEPSIYLPGTPTVAFLEYLELFVSMLRR